MKHFNELTPAEAERLAILMEECGEVVRVCGKILRHGYESYHPKNGAVNRESLENELGDMANIIDMMIQAGDLDVEKIEEYQDKKAANIGEYLHHN